MAEHTCNLQSHLADSDGKIHHLREELARSEASRLSLQQNFEAKTMELQKTIDHMQSLDKLKLQKSETFQNEIAHLKGELANSEMNLANSQHAFEKKASEAQYLAQLAHTLEDQLVNYQKKMVTLQGESAQLRRELSKCEAKQSELYYRLEQQLDEWLNEKASLESRVDDMEGKFQQSVGAIQGVFSRDQSSVSAKSEGFQDTSGIIQGPQGLVQTLLELGEAFLVSKIGEEDFHELQGKLNAARTRDDNIIRELQHKIQELSEMGAMVTRLKEELIEEKEKAKEEAEDMTQEMAELRYQLMEMVEHERELRSYTEQASMRRIAELEEQVKHAQRQTMLSLGRRQAAEAVSESRALEIRHLKSALEETRQSHTNIVSQKGELEERLTSQLKECQAKVNGLETDLSKARDEVTHLKVWGEKLVQAEKDSVALGQEMEEKLSALEQERNFLQIGIVEVQQLLKDFKHEIEELAKTLQRSEMAIEGASALATKDKELRGTPEAILPPLPLQNITAEEKHQIYADEKHHPGGIGPDSTSKEEVKELSEVASFSSSEHHDVDKKLTSFHSKHGATEKTLQSEGQGNDSFAKEELWTGDRKQEESTGSLLDNQQLPSEVEVLQELQHASFVSSEHLYLEEKFTSFGAKHDVAEKTLQLEDIGNEDVLQEHQLAGDAKQEESICSLLENQRSQSEVVVLKEHQLVIFPSSEHLGLEEGLARKHEFAEKVLHVEDKSNDLSTKEEDLTGDIEQEESSCCLLENQQSHSEVDVLLENQHSQSEVDVLQKHQLAIFSCSEHLGLEEELARKPEFAEKVLHLQDKGNDLSTKEQVFTGDIEQEESICNLLENQQSHSEVDVLLENQNSESEVDVLKEHQLAILTSSEHLGLEEELARKHEFGQRVLHVEDKGNDLSTKEEVLAGDIEQEESSCSLLENQLSHLPPSEHLDLEKKLMSFSTMHEVAIKNLQKEDRDNDPSTKEEVLTGYKKQEGSITSLLQDQQSDSEVDVLKELPYHLQSQLITTSTEGEISPQRLEQNCGENNTYLMPSLSVFIPLANANAHNRNQEHSWPTKEIIELVDSVTEELAKLLRLVLKSPVLTKQDLLLSLESRLHAWSNIPQKDLSAKVWKSGSIGEWGDLVVDLIGQSRRELLAMQHKIKDFEAEEEFNETIRAERISLSKEAAFLKEELAMLEARYTSEVARREDEVCALKRTLEHSNVVLLDTQRKAAEQEDTVVLLRGKVRKFELEAERSKSAWVSEKQLLEAAVREQYGNVQKEKQRGSKEVGKLEKRIKGLLHRLEENEAELGELMELGGINTDAVVAAKLRRLEQDLKDCQATEAGLQAQRAELASQVVWLQAKLEEAEQELQAEIEQHVEVLIRYEEERGLTEIELEAAKKALSLQQTGPECVLLGREAATVTERVDIMAETFKEQNNIQSYKKLEDLLFSKEANLQSEKKLRIEAEIKCQELQRSLEETLCNFSAIESELKYVKSEVEELQNSLHVTEGKLLRSIEEEHSLKESIQLLEEKLTEQNQLVDQEKEELILHTGMSKMTSQVSSLDLEVLVLRQQMMLFESQVSEKDMTISKLQEALMLESMKLSQAQEETNLQTERLTRQEEDCLRLKVKFSSLLSNLALLQANLGETRKREIETQALVKKLELELSVAKEEVVKSEVRLQRTLKQSKEQLYGERRKLEDAIHGQKQSEWFLARQLEHSRNLEDEKVALQKLVDQLRARSENAEKERDELKFAYSELENQFSRKAALGK